MVLLGSAAVAMAQTPSQDAYGGVLGEQVGGGSGGGGGQVVDASGSGLPFTGADLGMIVLIGLTLVAVGAALRFATRTQQTPL
jgi:hypothetical protein